MSSTNAAQSKSDHPPLIEKSTVLRLIQDRIDELEQESKKQKDTALDRYYPRSILGIEQAIVPNCIGSSLQVLKTLYEKINLL